MEKRQKGFTLVEIAIVLVIMGIILGAVLKGQELIHNAKVKRVQSQIQELMAAVYTYYDKYGYYPGDDPSASTRWSATDGNGNGYIDGGYCDSASEESCLLWSHLRYANIISGNPAETNPNRMTPRHAFGGPINIFHYTTGGQTGLWITLRTMEVDAAAAIDRAIDDGKCNTGSMIRYSGAACNGSDYPASGTLDVWIRF
jgi:prepilin-type N-terminal cleavage/methylation domain-containing protein